MKVPLFLFITLLVIACNSSKKYYYVQDSKEEKVFNAISDSAAYLKAYEYFQISEKVYKDMKSKYGSAYLDQPISYKLLNSKREDITYRVHFLKKDSLLEDVSNNIKELPNTISNARNESIEERNGVGSKYDTLGLYKAPVKVINAKFVTQEYSNYKDVSLKYKNVSQKKISAIRFKWYGENAFNEPADMGSLDNGWGNGFTDDLLRPGVTESGVWSVLSKDGKKILIAYPYEVAFEDGSIWKLAY